MPGLIAELKRRNVFRVAVMYVITAWVVVQVSDAAVPALQLPEWVNSLVFLLLALGFPVALILAWAFELTPEGIKLEKDVVREESTTASTGRKIDYMIISVMAIAIVLLVLDRFSTQQPEAEQVIAESTSKVQSIAVLPFADMSAEGDQEYFADGIAEEILNVLAKSRDLRVAGRTSSFQFKDKRSDLRDIGRQLGVAHILEGSVRKQGDRVRVTAQLIEVNTGFHLWSEAYERQLDDIFQIQQDMAMSISNALAVTLSLDSAASMTLNKTTNMDAYEEYLRARQLLSQRSRGDSLRQAISLLEEVTTLDPNFADAWATLAQAWALGHYWYIDKRANTLPKGEATALRALELEPNNAMALSALADVYRDRYEWQKAQAQYLKALELNPNAIESNNQYGQMLMRVGKPREALVYMERARQLDPLAPVPTGVLGLLHLLLGDYDKSLHFIERARVLTGNVVWPHRLEIFQALSRNDTERARSLTENLPDLPSMPGFERIEHEDTKMAAIFDSPEKASEILHGLWGDHTNYADNGLRASYAAYFGEHDLAIAVMVGETSDDAWMQDGTWQWAPLFSVTRKTDGFKKFVRKMKLDEYWRENGWGEFCQPVGEDDFTCR